MYIYLQVRQHVFNTLKAHRHYIYLYQTQTNKQKKNKVFTLLLIQCTKRLGKMIHIKEDKADVFKITKIV